MSEILAHLPPLSRTAVLDILLVAFLIYGVLRLVRGTRASLMLLGLAGLALAMQVFSRDI